MSHTEIRARIDRRGPAASDPDAVVTEGALHFLAGLAAEFRPRLTTLLAARRERQRAFDAGAVPSFLPDTEEIRNSAWKVAPIPAPLLDRRVEITGPVDRKMVINALNSGANVFMADFEDATAPTWKNLYEGQVNLRDAVRGDIEFRDAARDKVYRVVEHPAELLVRPRGLHLPERHLWLEDEPLPGALVDFGLFFYHNAPTLLGRGRAPYFYLPKLQHHLEARWWCDVFRFAEQALAVPRGSIRATVLIETLPAAFQMDEILFELRDYAAGLNCGRWDYIFSCIKTRRADAAAVMPDRDQVTMTQPFMRAYTQLLIKTCHRRGIHAMGGMAAQIPIKTDVAANERALAKVRADKLREAKDGHDGTWVAHPGLVALAREQFDACIAGAHQIDRLRDDVVASAAELLQVPEGTRTEAGLRHNLRVGVRYIEAWLGGLGCVPLYDLMEDAATAEISRAQVWQWIHHRAPLEDGSSVDAARLRAILDEELAALRDELGAQRYDAGHFAAARALFERLATAPELDDFLTLPAYELLLNIHG